MITLPLDGKLSLQNDGRLELFFIGVGSAFARTLNHTNFFIIKGDTHILVDFGTTGPHALATVANIEPTDVQNLFPTHSHADHIGGIEYLVLLNRYVGMKFLNKPKTKLIINEAYEKVLWNASLRGGLEWNEIDSEYKCLGMEDYFDIVPMKLKMGEPREVWEVDFGGIHLEIFRTNHVPDSAVAANSAFLSYGVHIDDRVFVSCDTKFDEDLIQMYANRAECFFHDASFFPNPVHASIQELRTLPPDVKKKMYLMHYGDNYAEQDVADFAGFAQQGVRYIF